MTKCISFSDIRFVERLVDGPKTQTTRKPCQCHDDGVHHQVGDRVQLMFRQRTPHNFFCGNCGSGAKTEKELITPPIGHCPYCGSDERPIVPKHFADATISKVDEITMLFCGGATRLGIRENGVEYSVAELAAFAKRDGFDDIKEIYDWFMKNVGIPEGAYKVYHFEDITPIGGLTFKP